MPVVGQRTVSGVDQHEAAYVDVFSNFRHQFLAHGIDAAITAGQWRREQGVKIGRGLLEGCASDRGSVGAKVVALGDEIGLAVDLDHCRTMTVITQGNLDRSFCGHLAGSFSGLGQPTLAHQFDRSVDVAAGLDQGFLALHHSGAGALTQLLDHARGNRHVAKTSMSCS